MEGHADADLTRGCWLSFCLLCGGESERGAPGLSSQDWAFQCGLEKIQTKPRLVWLSWSALQ